MTRALDYYRFQGTPEEMGAAHGEACRPLIERHLDLALAKLDRAGVRREEAVSVAQAYRPFVAEHAPEFDEEITGLAEGASIGLGEAYLLQLRAEAYAEITGRAVAGQECTTFAVLPEVTATGQGLAGQNADLPEMYEELMIVVHLVPRHGPEILMVTPAGQISYIGISSDGMASFANFLDCEGWTRGFPRYLFSRYALAQRSVESALRAVSSLPRASSRNLLMLDRYGAADFENTPSSGAVLLPDNGVLAHSNHYLAEELRLFDCAKPENLANSHRRYARMCELLEEHRGELSPAIMADILRDRSDGPDSLSVEPGDKRYEEPTGSESYMTVASVIASPGEGRLWACSGPPSRAIYTEYSMAEGRIDGATL